MARAQVACRHYVARAFNHASRPYHRENRERHLLDALTRPLDRCGMVETKNYLSGIKFKQSLV